MLYVSVTASTWSHSTTAQGISSSSKGVVSCIVRPHTAPCKTGWVNHSLGVKDLSELSHCKDRASSPATFCCYILLQLITWCKPYRTEENKYPHGLHQAGREILQVRMQLLLKRPKMTQVRHSEGFHVYGTWYVWQQIDKWPVIRLCFAQGSL